MHPGEGRQPVEKKTKWGFDGVEMRLRAPSVPGRRFRSALAFVLTLPGSLRTLARIVRRYDIRIINVHYPTPGFALFAVARWILPVKLVVSVHGMDLVPTSKGPVRPPLGMRMLLRAADLLVAPSRGFLEQCASILPRSLRTVAIHNGIEVDESAQGLGESRAAAPFVLAVASHDEWKGLDVLLRALARLRDAGTPIAAVLAGDGPLRADLEALTDRLALRPLVRFAGACGEAQLNELLRDSSMVVLPSRAESFGIAAVEALAVERPVIATTVGGLPEIICHDVHGLLVAPDDAVALADAIARLAGNASLRAEFGRAGRRRVIDHFTWQRAGKDYQRAFEGLSSPSPSSKPRSFTRVTGIAR
jgi:glycosyltransferase involved in cell wall biosynthesis